jgi:hypothetical protein
MLEAEYRTALISIVDSHGSACEGTADLPDLMASSRGGRFLQPDSSPAFSFGGGEMKFMLVNGRTPRSHSFCAMCCDPIGESYLRELGTGLSYCNHDCYIGNIKIHVPALQYQARAS